MSLPPPLCNGRYELQKMVGEGGMASVYIALDQVLGVHRAIKVLAPRLCANQRIRQRFIDEARAMARMRHPNIVTVHDVGVDEGVQPYIIMELVRGGSVGDLLVSTGGQPPEVAGPILLSTLRGLQCAHETGIVHRDIKPDNILLTRGGVAKLTDFGIAQIESTDHAMTRTGAVLGTIAYMAPEQRRDSKGVTLKADLYSAGATLFALLEGSDPFDLYAREMQKSLLGNIPVPLRDVIIAACSFEPAHRYESAEAMGVALTAALHTMGVDLKADLSIALPEGLQELSGAWNADSGVGGPRPAAETSDFSETSVGHLLSGDGAGVQQREIVAAHRPKWFALASIVLCILAGAAWFGSLGASDEPVCGDGVVDRAESCDDGNQVMSDTCTNECELNVVFMHGATPSSAIFMLGSEEVYSERPIAELELPATPILLSPFWIDRHEVTREAFWAWRKAQGVGEGVNWGEGKP